MKIRIKSCIGELPDYLTYGKEYEVVKDSYNILALSSDNNSLTLVRLDDCYHLNGGSWEIVEDE